MTLTGPRHIMGEAFLNLQGARKFDIGTHHEGHVDQVFSAPLDRVVRTEIPEINRWFMDRIGSISFIPDVGAILTVDNDRTLLARYDRFSRGVPPGEGDP